MRKTYGIHVLIGGIPKTHKITFTSKKREVKAGSPSSFRQWQRAELEKKRALLSD